MCARNRVSDASIGKVHEFVLSLDKAGFSLGQMQNVINSEKNRYAKVMHDAFTKARTEDVFDFLGGFEIVVPEKFDYLDTKDLENFLKMENDDSDYISHCLSNFYDHECEARLTPGRKFDVKIFQAKSTAEPEDCMSLLRSQKAQPMGNPGLMLAYNQHQTDFPVGKWTFSLNKEQVFYGFEHNRFPRTLRISHGLFLGGIDDFQCNTQDISRLDSDECILCFCSK